MSFSTETVHSIMSPVDASKLSGRYEITAEVNGKQVQVLRSIRHAPRNLVLRGSLTPQKAKPTSAGDVDDLCNLFQRKANVTPQGKKKAPSARTPSARYAKKKVDEEADSAKENLGKVLKSAQKKNVVKSTRFSDDTKAAVSPVRRSRRLSRS